MFLQYGIAIITVTIAMLAIVTIQSADAQPISPRGYGAYVMGCYPYGYSTWNPYYCGGCNGGYGYSPWIFANNNRFNTNNNAINTNAVTSAFNSHQNEVDHIANSDVNAFTTANNVCANNNFVKSDNHNVIG
jgi:hypothetical protein